MDVRYSLIRQLFADLDVETSSDNLKAFQQILERFAQDHAEPDRDR